MDGLIDFLEDNGLEILDVAENEITILYKFDLVEINAATSYANELDDIDLNEKEVEKKQYLTDIAADNIADIIEDAIEEIDINLKYEILENEIVSQKFKIILK